MELEKKCWHTVIIGAGQAGLSTGYFLKKKNTEFIILDKNEKIGDSWRNRWDSLLLFTPSQHDGLPGMPFPGPKGSFPDKNQMADYLKSYAMKFALPIQCNVKVNHLAFINNHYEIDSSEGMVFANRVVIATGTNPSPYIPALASNLAPKIFQIHSSQYINPESIPAGDVLVVGAGTSGVEIALEISKTHTTYISGKPTFHIPDKILRYAGELYWWLISNILTLRTPIGKKARKSIIGGGAPLIRVSSEELDIKGIKRLPRLTGVKNSLPQFEDENVLAVSSIIWATGYKPNFSWINMDISDETGWPKTRRGVSVSHEGLYFNGMPFQFGLTSGLVGGVGRDAEYISKQILRPVS
jgi:putative flavoprotein involved in K+ transport